MRTSATLRQQLRQLVGPQVYRGCILQKRVLTEFLLASEANKQAVNEIVHPAVALDFIESDYQWLESAILFDSGFHRRVPFSFVVCVSAPEDVRVQRIMARDGISEAKALEWIHRQMPQEQVEAQSDFVIVNDGVAPLEPQVDKLIHQLDSLPQH
jgi:dephospho-CoA kinase